MDQEDRRSPPRTGAAVAAGLFLFGLLLVGWPSARRGDKVLVTAQAPEATPLKEGERPRPVYVLFSAPAARLDSLGKEVAVGVRLEPPVRGSWMWEDDRRLAFRPVDEWPIGRAYRVVLEPKALAPGLKLLNKDISFRTAEFGGAFISGEFYVDPLDPNVRRVAATLNFSHPVDLDDLTRRVSARFEPGARGLLTPSPVPVTVTVKLDKLGGNAFVVTQPLALPERDGLLRVTVAAGARSWRGGPPLRESLESAVRVPGRYGLLAVKEARLEIVRDDKSEPQQALLLDFSTGVNDGPAAAAVSAWILPKDIPAIQDRPARKDIGSWKASEVGPEVLALSTRAVLTPFPSEKDHAALHSFRFSAPPEAFLFLSVNAGLEAYGGFTLAHGHNQVMRVPPYPRQIRILHEGALLSSEGRHTLSLASEGVEHARFELGRLLPGRVAALAAQSGGDYAHPVFRSGEFGEDDVVERFESFRSPRAEPGKVSYLSFDFGTYLQGRHGVFFFAVQDWDEKKKKARGPEDRRLIVVTDLGLVVKESADGTRDVFIQRLSTGRPAGGTRVEVLGRNGLPVVAAVADESGRAHFPKLDDFKREKQPVAYLAKLGDDLSFLPYGRQDRRLDFSRFDVGGAYSEGRREKLEAYLFTDRGLYRPGETIHAAALIRAQDWAPAPGTPLEMVVTDPRGLEVQRTKIALSTAAFEELSYVTEESALTGGYAFSLYTVKDKKRRALLGAVTARVEEFLPDRLKIRVTLSKENEEGWVDPRDLQGRVVLKTLYGSDAEGRRVGAGLTLTPAAPRFKRFSEYRFFDPAAAKKTFTERLEETTSSASGEAAFALDLGRFASGTYRLTFSAEGFEAGSGRGVAGEASVLVSPRPFLLGLKSDGDLSFVRRGGSRTISAVAVGPDALPRALSAVLETRERLLISALVRQEDGLLRYKSVERVIVLSTQAVIVPLGGASWPLWTRRAGDFTLAVRDEAGLELNRLDYMVAGAADLARPTDRDAELQLSLEKADYVPGEEVSVRVRAPYAGAGLMTIERDRVYAHKWFQAGTTASVQTITLPREAEGNAYVNVQFLRAPGSPEIFMSPLSYGAAPFTISRSRRTLPLTVSVPEKIRPGETLTIRVKAGARAKAAVWLVDEGILQAAGYKTPDPLSFFLRKRALEVRTYQLLDLVLPEPAAGGDKGGDALGRNLNPFKRKTEPPVAYWAGLVDVGEQGTEVRWKVPESFNGTLRVLAVAASPSSLGVAEARVLARSPLVLQLAGPLFAAPGDEFELTASLSNGVAGSGVAARARLLASVDGRLEILSPSAAVVELPEGRERAAAFRFKVRPALGSTPLKVTATLGEESVVQTWTLSVRPASPREISTSAGFLRAGRSASAATPRKLFPQHRLLEAEASALPLALARGLLAYLQDYPHGCTEQITSQAFPALVLVKQPDFGYAPEKAAASLDRALRILRARQNADGSFGYWAAGAEVDLSASVYALHFLTEAKEAGLPVAPEMLERGLVFLRAVADEAGGLQASPRLRAQAIYLLTRHGKVTTESLEQLRRETEGDKFFRGDIGAAYMAAAYKLLRLDSRAESRLEGLAFDADTQVDYLTFYDEASRNAQLLYLYGRHFPERLTRLTQRDWDKLTQPVARNSYNTQSAAYSILAFATTPAARASVSAQAEGRALPLTDGVFRRAPFGPGAREVVFKNEGALPVFYSALQAGFDQEPPAAELRAKLDVSREYLDAAGRPVKEAKVGEELTVRLRLRAVGATVPRVALIDLLPGGLEASAERGQAPAGAWTPEYFDVREDRVNAYGTAQPDSADFTYRVRAVARGKYVVPAAYAESMYDRSAKARALPSIFEVR